MHGGGYPTIRAIVRSVGPAGYLGVDLFFALSGFVLAYTYHAADVHSSGRAFGAFPYKRLARICPLHVCTLLLMAGSVWLLDILGVRYSARYFIDVCFRPCQP
jgi:peptidoglycan/LPS O-acetylase OafA/YrhL